MTADQRERLDQLRSEQAYLLARGELHPRLDPALAACTAGGMSEAEERVAFARANRNLMRGVLGEPRGGARPWLRSARRARARPCTTRAQARDWARGVKRFQGAAGLLT